MHTSSFPKEHCNDDRLTGFAIYWEQSTDFLATWPATPMTTSKTSAGGAEWLLDTGPLVALLSKRDSAHAACVEALEGFRGRLITTEPVLTEAMHLVRRQPGAQEVCLDFFLQGGAMLVEMTAERLASCKMLVARYRDIPMDFADATLVSIADELGLATVFTLDRRGFLAYRWRKTRRFEIVP